VQRDQRERRARPPSNWNQTPLAPFIRGTGTGVVASREDEYRRRAQECREMARAFRDRDARVSLAYMAHAWLRLADMTAPEADDKE